MIRIDEVYSNTFWSYLEKYRPNTRLLCCDPFGRSDPASIKHYSTNVQDDQQYIFFFDQEPIHLDLHQSTFQHVKQQTSDISIGRQLPKPVNGKQVFTNKPMDMDPWVGYFVTSERDSEFVDYVCKQYKWSSLYYFFHGWAALDWYRGYDRTFLMPAPEHRQITKTFIAPNRIIAGKRQHRLLMLYHIFKQGMTNNWISCPAICPGEHIATVDAAAALSHIYPDIAEVFASQLLPLSFFGEHDSPMHSCWLSLFDESADSLLYLVTETVAEGRRHHLTEKIFKPIALGMPFVLVSTYQSLAYLRSYGFQTFGDFWDESYDNEVDDIKRIERIAKVLSDLDQLSQREKNNLFHAASAVVKHNQQHFYNGGFEAILWQELQQMLSLIK